MHLSRIHFVFILLMMSCSVAFAPPLGFNHVRSSNSLVAGLRTCLFLMGRLASGFSSPAPHPGSKVSLSGKTLPFDGLFDKGHTDQLQSLLTLMGMSRLRPQRNGPLEATSIDEWTKAFDKRLSALRNEDSFARAAEHLFLAYVNHPPMQNSKEAYLPGRSPESDPVRVASASEFFANANLKREASWVTANLQQAVDAKRVNIETGAYSSKGDQYRAVTVARAAHAMAKLLEWARAKNNGHQTTPMRYSDLDASP